MPARSSASSASRRSVPSSARGANRDASMRCTTSTPSAITRPLPLGRSGLRSTLLRSRKSSSRGSAGSSTSMTSAAHALSSTMADIRSAAVSSVSALLGIERGQPLLQPLLAGAALGLDQLGAGRRHRHQHLTAVAGMGGAVDEAQLGQRGDHPRHRRRPDPLPHRLTRPGSSRPPWPASTAPTAATAKPAIPARRNRNCRASRTTASDRSLASRASGSFTRQRIPSSGSEGNCALIGYVWHR